MNLAAVRAPGLAQRHILNAVIWILAVQALFWAFALLVRSPTIDPIFKRHEVTDIMLVTPDGQRKQAGGRPDYYLGEGLEAKMVGTVEIDRPDQGLVVFAPRYNRTIEAGINGQVMPMSDAPAARGNLFGAKWVVPAQLLQRGRNTITLDVRRPCCRAYLATLIAAPPGAIDVAIREWRLKAES